MKFWLDWQAHRVVLLILGVFGILCALPPWAAAWILLTVAALVFYAFLYAIVYAVANSDLDPHKDSGRH